MGMIFRCDRCNNVNGNAAYGNLTSEVLPRESNGPCRVVELCRQCFVEVTDELNRRPARSMRRPDPPRETPEQP